MNIIYRLNPELKKMLEDWQKWFDEQDDHDTILPDPGRDFGHTLETATSSDYLEEVRKESHRGTPECAIVTDFHVSPGSPKKYRDSSLELCTNVCSFLGAKFTAVHAYYPTNGFMGWHCNWDTPGYNILLSYTKNGEGFFRHTKDSSITTLHDTPGWSAKVGYFGGKDEDSSKHVWHCAGSTEPRHTLGFVIPDLDMWEMMCQDIDEDWRRSLFP